MQYFFKINSGNDMRTLISICLCVFIVNILHCEEPKQNITAITGCTVIKTTKNDSIPNATVLIQDNKIIKVGKSGKVKIPENATVIDAKGKYIIPGLVDSHIHFFQSGGLYTRPDALDLRQRLPYLDELKWIRDNIDDLFKRYIRCGITTIFDLGGPYWNFDIREKARNSLIAPRVFTTGPLIASYQPGPLTTDDPPIIKVKTKEEAIELVRKIAEKKPDFIKIWYVVSRTGSSGLEEFYPIVQAIVEESHKLGLQAWCHATELETARKSLQAGVDVLVHDLIDKEIDDNFLELAKEKNVILIPTMWVFNSYDAVFAKKLDLMKVEHLLGNPKVIGSFYDMYELSDKDINDRIMKLWSENKPIQPKPQVLSNVKRMLDNGIPLAAGTDAGNIGVVHGPGLFHEFALMSQAGLSNHDILVSATLNGAKLLNRENELGSIEEGKLADLVILNSNPLENIQNCSDIFLVMKDGKTFDPSKILQPTAEELVQIQLNAYNSKSLEAFLSVYSQEVEVYNFPAELQFKGIDKMREVYTEFFKKSGELHCKLLNRNIQGNHVIDSESITTGIPGREHFLGTAIYEISDGLIKKIWFIK
jgi:imidazolonepropionase-like amidohydrolase